MLNDLQNKNNMKSFGFQFLIGSMGGWANGKILKNPESGT